ncbi:MAG: L-threonylcarbamoyladenylate synthase [Gammaproteobacteria bacterium]|nr:L-threonylcarbamoyladenylate synthase [Gammaproteobacteria bacterium]
MSQYFRIHPKNPQLRLIRQTADIIRSGGVIVYPTDSSYALGCQIGDKNALTKIRQIRRLPQNHNFTLVCRDLSELATYAKVDNSAYRLLRSNTPGAYTFLLPATREVPRRLVHPRKKTIGIRVPDNLICQALLEELAEPIMSSTLMLPGDKYPLSDPDEIREMLQHQVDLIVDGGYGGLEITTMISLETDSPQVIREGLGDIAPFVA